MHLYLSTLNPIDWHAGALRLQDVLDAHLDPDTRLATELLTAQAKRVIRAHLAWEGDIREGPYLIVARTIRLSGNDPDTQPSLRILGVYFKQDNNGTTFCASLIPITTDTHPGETAEADIEFPLPWTSLELPLSLNERQADAAEREESLQDDPDRLA